MKSRVFRNTAWALALGLVTLAPGAWAGQGDDKGEKDEKKVEKRRIVVVDRDGERRVIEGEGLNVRRGFLGVGLTDLSSELRTHFGVSGDAGVMVASVESGSPADKAGIKVGDIITSFDRDQVESSCQQVAVEVVRDGRPQSLTVSMVQKERPEMDLAPFFTKDGEGENMVFRAGPGAEAIRIPTWTEKEGGPGPRVHVIRGREAELEKQLKQLEKRIAELERQLEKK
jgi:hypothetical protein